MTARFAALLLLLAGGAHAQSRHEQIEEARRGTWASKELSPSTSAVEPNWYALSTSGGVTAFMLSLPGAVSRKGHAVPVTRLEFTAGFYANSGNWVDWGTAVPTTGVWKVGDVRFNSSPAVGQPSFWQCITAGDFAGTPPVFLASRPGARGGSSSIAAGAATATVVDATLGLTDRIFIQPTRADATCTSGPWTVTKAVGSFTVEAPALCSALTSFDWTVP